MVEFNVNQGVLKSLFKSESWPRTLVFIILGGLFALFLQQMLLIGLSRNDEGNVGIINHVMRGQINAEILISGSSRAMYHYIPSLIESETKLKTFNIGRNGTKLHEQLELLHLFLMRNSPPTYLIQNLDFTSFEKNDDITDPKQYIYWLDNEDVFTPLFQRKKYFILYRWFPLLAMVRTGAMQSALEGLFKLKGSQISDLKGYVPQLFTWNQDFDKLKAQSPLGISWTIDAQKIKTLENIIALCKKKGIKVIFIHSPVYYDTGGFFKNQGEIINQFKTIADKSQVAFWDYSKDPISYKKAYFYNSQHLNHEGANNFSKLIAYRIKIEILKK